MGIYVNLQVMMESEYIIEHKVHTNATKVRLDEKQVMQSKWVP